MSQSEFANSTEPNNGVAAAPSRAACVHVPPCPSADGPDRDAAHVLVCHPEQGWSLLCNGIVLFEDTGEILPDGHCIQARRADLTASALHRVAC
ncbi:MAG TPA: DUF5999 family protein [Jatrophihabitans sp.]|nr:DUF5999 family protein [Jatrophihabitans sp.]